VTGIWYCARGDVTSALDISTTARRSAQVDRAIEAASRSVEALCHRRFYPWTGTRYFDWPNNQSAAPYRLWLDADELISVTTLVASGTTISAASYVLEPNNVGPPYTRLEILTSTSASFGSASTSQRAIAITGVYGACADEAVAGVEWGAGVTAVATTMTVTDCTNFDVGAILRVGSERMIVTGRTMVTTYQTLQTPITASAADVSLPVVTGSLYGVGETILLDGERMLIVDIAGNTLTVRRAYDGTVLAAHAGSTIYAPRQLTITRGQLGTAAAVIAISAAITRHVPPPLVTALTIAEASRTLSSGLAGYADDTDTRGGAGSGSGKARSGIDGLREQVYAQHGRKARMRVI
jgi:hypothetical protein